MGSYKIVMSIRVSLGGKRSSGVRISEEEMVNLKFPRKVESDIPLGQVMECLVGRLQRGILGS